MVAPPGSRATQDAKLRSVFYGAVSRSMRSTSSRGMWIAPANLSALSTPRSTISWTFPGVRSRYSAASHRVTFLRVSSSTLLTSLTGKDGSGPPQGYTGPALLLALIHRSAWKYRIAPPRYALHDVAVRRAMLHIQPDYKH